ncbi:MAG: GGDEF domain-containing protein [Magnetococcus sp. WYHC-3]
MGVLVHFKQRNPGVRGSRLTARHRDNLLGQLDLVQLLAESQAYSSQLSRLSSLLRDVAGQLDPGAMVDALSVWLGQNGLPHDLVAYRHPGMDLLRIHSQAHGTARRMLSQSVSHLLEGDYARGAVPGMAGHFFHRVPLDGQPHGARVVLIHGVSDQSDDSAGVFLRTLLPELAQPFQRAFQYERAVEQASRDALTGLINRRVFSERMQHEMALSRRSGRPLSLVFLDLDHFKAINDGLGHAAGDAALVAVSRAWEQEVRQSDMLARLGGDEFALLLADADECAAYRLAARLCQAVGELAIVAPDGRALGVSIGVCGYQASWTLSQWMEGADAALYQAKASGRNQVCLRARAG